jgi:phage tail sheath protein FI
MPLFVNTKAEANRHGVFALEKLLPTVITPTGTGVAAIVEQFAWGPVGQIFTPAGRGDLLNTLAPPGMSRTSAGYLALIKKAFPLLKAVRVLGLTAATASAVINRTGPVALVTVVLKSPGTAGNAVVVTTSAATDGDTNHFNITVSVTGASGTTTDTIENWNASNVGTPSALTAADLLRLTLVGSITNNSVGVPIISSTTCSGGTDGTIDAAAYVGTAGTGDRGLAKLEGDKTIDHVFTADPGNSLRAAVNAGIRAHVDARTDRIGYINGNSAQTAAAAQTDVASNRSQRLVYCDPWVYITDDVAQARQLVPSAVFAASLASQLPPSTSIAWKGDVVGTMLGGILDLEADRGDATALNTKAGIATFIREDEGGFRIEAGVTTIAPVNPLKKNLTRSRTGIYIARSIAVSIRGMTDIPNLPVYQQQILDAITSFMETLKKNGQTEDAVFLPHVRDYEIGDVAAENQQPDLDAGDFSVPLTAKTSSAMERIFINTNFGETVQITAA